MTKQDEFVIIAIIFNERCEMAKRIKLPPIMYYRNVNGEVNMVEPLETYFGYLPTDKITRLKWLISKEYVNQIMVKCHVCKTGAGTFGFGYKYLYPERDMVPAYRETLPLKLSE